MLPLSLCLCFYHCIHLSDNIDRGRGIRGMFICIIGSLSAKSSYTFKFKSNTCSVNLFFSPQDKYFCYLLQERGFANSIDWWTWDMIRKDNQLHAYSQALITILGPLWQNLQMWKFPKKEQISQTKRHNYKWLTVLSLIGCLFVVSVCLSCIWLSQGLNAHLVLFASLLSIPLRTASRFIPCVTHYIHQCCCAFYTVCCFWIRIRLLWYCFVCCNLCIHGITWPYCRPTTVQFHIYQVWPLP